MESKMKNRLKSSYLSITFYWDVHRLAWRRSYPGYFWNHFRRDLLLSSVWIQPHRISGRKSFKRFTITISISFTFLQSWHGCYSHWTHTFSIHLNSCSRSVFLTGVFNCRPRRWVSSRWFPWFRASVATLLKEGIGQLHLPKTVSPQNGFSIIWRFIYFYSYSKRVT